MHRLDVIEKNKILKKKWVLHELMERNTSKSSLWLRQSPLRI